MNQQQSDQGWQQLQDHIEGFFAETLRSNVQRTAYKPLFVAPMLEMPPSECHQNELRGSIARNDNFGQKGAGR